jgi:hypothetical protein
VTTMMLEVPAALKGMLPALEELVRETARQVARGAALSPLAGYDEFEQKLRERAAAVESAAHELALAALDVDLPRVRIDGVEHVRVGRYATTFMAQSGGVQVTRSLFRRVGQRNGPTIDVVALRAGAIDGVWLPGTARMMAHLLQQGTSREAEATAKEMGRLPYSRSSFERVGHAVGRVYVGQRERVERSLIESLVVPDVARSISLSLDRVAVPMEEPRPRPAGRPAKNAAKRPVSRTFRMAYCGTVTLHDEDGEAVRTIRYGTMPGGDPEKLCAALVDDALAMRGQRPDLRLVLLCDGAPEMWNLLRSAIPAGIEYDEILDFYHTVEKLAPAAKVVFGEGAPAAIQRWKLALLNRHGAAMRILTELVDSGKEDVNIDSARPVHDAITYLRNNAGKMLYAAARESGLPIGSGNVEATCKTLVGVRMKRCGSRWKIDTGEHVIQLRALALSDRWGDAMALTLRPPRVSVRSAA